MHITASTMQGLPQSSFQQSIWLMLMTMHEATTGSYHLSQGCSQVELSAYHTQLVHELKKGM